MKCFKNSAVSRISDWMKTEKGQKYKRGKKNGALIHQRPLTSVPIKRIVATYVLVLAIVPVLYFFWQILISYCKFIMQNALK